MSDYRWDGSPYQPAPQKQNGTDAIEVVVKRVENLERALYKIALDAKSLEAAQHIASETIFKQSIQQQHN